MGLFSNLKTYAAKWQFDHNEEIPADDIEQVESITVVAGDYGHKSAEIHTKEGGLKYIGLDVNSEGKVALNDALDIQKCFYVCLKRGTEVTVKLGIK